MTDNFAEQAQQQLRELRDSIQTQLADECIRIDRHLANLAEARARRDELVEALKRVEAALTPRTRKRKETASQ